VLGAERLFLNPDCGFGTFADRPVATPRVAYEKLRALAQAAADLRASAPGELDFYHGTIRLWVSTENVWWV
jgi:hypothetical protein